MKYGYSLPIVLLLSVATIYPCTGATQASGKQLQIPWSSLTEVSYYHAGDASFTGQVNIADIIYLVNYLFRRGAPPMPFYALGDADCSGTVGVSDIIRLVNYIFRYSGSKVASPCDFTGRYFLDATGNDEATFLALWYAEEIEAPAALTERFHSDLQRIRTELWNVQPNLDGIFFWEPWEPSLIQIGVDSVTAAAIRDSSYHAWDAQNGQLGLDSVRGWLDFGYDVYFKLYFSGVKNSDVIAQAYAGLPGVFDSRPPGSGGEPSNGVWPHQEGDTITYLFHVGWGDCPSGCVHKRFFFVGANSDSVWYIGEWLRVSGQGAPPPSWWPDACLNLSRTYWKFLCP